MVTHYVYHCDSDIVAEQLQSGYILHFSEASGSNLGYDDIPNRGCYFKSESTGRRFTRPGRLRRTNVRHAGRSV
ncbi:hypothetical protein RRG08_041381 [Elysia crispata]|uniref:Uncharacterized protein n=1 Tax=Elysia crispata TaxID=231223 RepID=A0AAE1CKN7_9GAST|nr:hypothetical protein RRG08_041381 [Elysia crispata]